MLRKGRKGTWQKLSIGFSLQHPMLTKSPEQPLAPPHLLHSLQPSGAAAAADGTKLQCTVAIMAIAQVTQCL